MTVYASVKMRDMAFLADGISDNLSETPEGYLVCHNVPIARTGTQEYYGREIGAQDRYHDIVTVHRLQEDVFSQDTLKSFEGKPVTENHPPEGVGPGNYGIYTKGHAQNIRKQGIYIVADLLIMDPILIQKVRDKELRQVSAGYDCEYEPYKGGYRQRSIRANHIAVVERGRAGPRVSIKDSETVKKKRRNTIMNREKLLGAMLKTYAADENTTADDLAAAMTLFAKDAEVKPEPTNDKGLVEKLLAAMTKDNSKKEPTTDAAVDQRLATLEKGMAKILKALDEEKEEEKEEKKTEDAISRMFDEDPEEEEKSADEDPDFVPKGATADEDEEEEETKDEEPEEEEGKKEAQDAALRAIVKDLKPVMAKLPKKQQQMVKDALSKSLKRQGKTESYSKIKKISQKAVHDSMAKQLDAYDKAAEEGIRIMEKFNPHYKKA